MYTRSGINFELVREVLPSGTLLDPTGELAVRVTHVGGDAGSRVRSARFHSQHFECQFGQLL